MCRKKEGTIVGDEKKRTRKTEKGKGVTKEKRGKCGKIAGRS